MSNRFHRLLTDGELHTPERRGDGDPNGQTIYLPVDGQYYQDVETGSIWRYRQELFAVEGEDELNLTVDEKIAITRPWELLIDYDKQTNRIKNIQRELAIQTNRIGFTRQQINADDNVNTVDAYLITQVKPGDELLIVQENNTSNVLALTVTNYVDGGEVTINTLASESMYTFISGSPILIEGAQFTAYGSTDPVKIIQGLRQERDASAIGRTGTAYDSDSIYDTVTITRTGKRTNVFLEAGQVLRIYSYWYRGGASQVNLLTDEFIVKEDVTLGTTATETIPVHDPVNANLGWRPSVTFQPSVSYVEQPSYSISGAVGVNAGRISFVANTASDLGNAIAAVNVVTGLLEANINALAQFDNNINTTISTLSLVANNAYAQANLAVYYDNVAGIFSLLAGPGGSEMTLSANSIEITGVITAINNNTTTTINGNRITAGTISADEIDAESIFGREIEVGNAIVSENFDSNNGFALYSNGLSIFRDVDIFVTNDYSPNSSGVSITPSKVEVNRNLTISGNAIPRLSFITNEGLPIGDLFGLRPSDNPNINLAIMVLESEDRTWLYGGPSDSQASSRIQLNPSGQIEARNDLKVTGNVQASYKSDDGTAGISGTFTWNDANAIQDHNVIVKNGIVTQWETGGNALLAPIADESAGISWNQDTDTYSAPVGFSTGACGIHTNIRRCVLSDAGVVQYYLDRVDSTQKAGGAGAANLDGTDGQVMAEIPKFYYKYEYSSNVHTWKISDQELSGFNLHPAFLKSNVEVDHRYVGVYEGIWYDADGGGGSGAYADPDNSDNLSIDAANDKVGSISGEYPIVGITRDQARTLCENRGTGWHQLDWNLIHAIQLLYLTEYGDFDSQQEISGGNTDYGTWLSGSGNTRSNESGLSNADGNETNGVSTSGGSVNDYMTYRGIENLFGNVWQWLDGIVVSPTGDDEAWYSADDYTDYDDDTTVGHTKIVDSMPSNGYIKTIQDVSSGFIPASTGGTSSTYLADYFVSDGNSADRVVRVGGNATSGGFAGVFSLGVNISSANKSRQTGCRLVY